MQDDHNFTISEVERAYCGQRTIPLPAISPLERFREMFAFRNERILFERKCSKTGKDIISCYRPETKFPVFEREVWLSDENNPLQYGRAYDFSRPFFEQFYDLACVVPREGKIGVNAENSPYVNLSMNVKNCYYTFGCLGDEDSMYAVKLYHSRDCVDCMYVTNCELCYECVNTHNSYDLRWSTHAFHCRESAFLYGCRNCSNCFGCVGLEHKQYCIWNVQYTKEEYEEKITTINTGKTDIIETFKQQLTTVVKETGYVYQSIISSEECSGAYIENSHNCHNSYFVRESDSLEHCFGAQKSKDSISIHTCIEGELNYRCIAIGLNSYNSQFCHTATNLVDSMYCAIVFHGEKMFGCIGIPRRASYCILNKQYSKEEYEELLPRVIAHMQSTNEWGKFFPMWMSDFPYIDTIAQEYFPLTEEEGKKLHVHWAQAKAMHQFTQTYVVPNDIVDVSDDICEAILVDTETQKPFRLQKKELEFYRNHQIPVPQESFETRHLRRSRELLAKL